MAQVSAPRTSPDGRRELLVSRTWVQAVALLLLCGFAVLGFPSNQFGQQEPGPESEIAEFCEMNYGVTFPMFSKLVTKAGAEQSPIYSYLGKTGSLPTWNFAKYLLDKDGKVVKFFNSKVTPEDPELRAAIEGALAQK